MKHKKEDIEKNIIKYLDQNNDKLLEKELYNLLDNFEIKDFILLLSVIIRKIFDIAHEIRNMKNGKK